jgi:hypothetical protein
VWLREQGDRTDLHDGGTVVGDSLPAILVDHEKVTAIGAECGLDSRLNSETCVDVGDDLTLALRGIGACVEECWSARVRDIVEATRGGGVETHPL